MATVPTLEQWVLEKLEARFGGQISATATESKFSVNLVAGQSLNKHIHLSDFLIDAQWLSKDASSEALAAVQQFLLGLEEENFILEVSIRTETSKRKQDSNVWKYISVVQFRHRVRPSWEV